MGINNRQRRAAKAKHRSQHANDRERRRGSPPGPSPGRVVTEHERVESLLYLAAWADDPAEAIRASALLQLSDPRIVQAEVERELLRLVARLWNNGWQPAELIRHARRHDGRVGRFIAAAVAADHAMRDPQTLHPRWAEQVVTLELPDVDGATGWAAAFIAREGVGAASGLEISVAAMQAIGRLGPLSVVLPPPGAALGSTARPPDTDDPVLARIRALLAQAESTSFEAEAETFTAKAEALMAKHAIDSARLWAASDRDERPVAIRVPIDDPYADIKSFLLQRVAHWSRCRAVWHTEYALSTIVGFASDVAATEMLFTSLLVQAQAALRAEGARHGPGSHTRSRSFRSSFLMAFTQRVDERLARISAAAEEAAGAGTSTSLLPALISRSDAVQAEVDVLFGSLLSSRVSGGADAAGWARGTLAADLARLNVADVGPAPDPRHTTHDSRDKNSSVAVRILEPS